MSYLSDIVIWTDEGGPFDIKEGLPLGYNGRRYPGATCLHAVISKEVGSRKKKIGMMVAFVYPGRRCTCCITEYDFKVPTIIYSKFESRPFELHMVVTGVAEYLLDSDSGRMAKSGSLNVLGYSGLENRVRFNAGTAMTIDYHFDESIFNALLKDNPKFKQCFKGHKYGDNFAQFENNINGDIPYFVQLVESINAYGKQIDYEKLEHIGVSLLLSALDLTKFEPINLIDWDCFSFAVNLPSIFKDTDFKMKEVKRMADGRGLTWYKVVNCTHMVYSCSPRTLIGDLKFKEFEELYRRNYDRHELKQHFGAKHSGQLVDFVMRHLNIDRKTFNKTYPFK